MPAFSHAALQQALYTKLTADATLMALVTGVYDYVPQDAAFPYVMIGEIGISPLASAAGGGMDAAITLRALSREGGRKQAAAILERLHALLHRGTLSLSGFTLISLRFTGSDIALLADGVSHEGRLRLRALAQAE